MKKISVITAVVFMLMAVKVFAHGGNDLILHGYIIDNMCAGTHKNDLGEFTKTHEKTCMLKPDCVSSGYSIYAEEDGQLHKFNAESNKTVEAFLKDPGNRTDVVIIAEKNAENNLIIESIKNRRIKR